jgi:2-polyprenyl-3-methyl-5-hydroxy-6-metoxy-1,4-benzoquinol methylase
MSESHSPTLAEQRQFWDWHWEHWQERGTINEWKDRRHDTILNLFRSFSVQQAKILDLGCGPGRYTEKLAQFGQVTGIDLSEDAIAMAQSRFPSITFLAGNLYELPLPAAHFDIVVSQEVIDHVEDRVAFLDRAFYVLKAGGYLILSCANKFVMDRLGDGEFPTQPAAHISQYLDIKGWKRLLHSHFRVLQIMTIIPIGNRGILRLVNSHKLNAVLGFLIPRQYLEALKERAGLGYTIILLAQKKY